MNKQENIEKLEISLSRLDNKENTIYFLVYDTKGNARASVKYIYDLALTLQRSEYKVKLLVEDKTYSGVESWLGEGYKELKTVSIKDEKVEINFDDILVVPEYYSNVLEQLSNVRCVKVMLVQQREYMFETLSIGSKWVDFGFDKTITTTQATKKYISEIFPQNLVYVIPPMIGDNFKPIELPQKPLIAISCRDRVKHRKLISEFYLKFPQLRWITFKDMVQLSYEEFSHSLKECMVSVWIDDVSTFGTFPLESMKCNVPVIGKIPTIEPDWLGDNGMWTYDENKIVEILGTYILAWLDGVELTDEVKENMRNTLLPYDSEITKNSIVAIFQSLINKRVDNIKTAIQNLKAEEVI